MRQRAMIAMAIACRPKLLIADEPTTALDVTTQSQILELLDGLRRDLAMALVLITHDLGIVARYADRVAVMYAGRVVEQADSETVFCRAAHPYTVALLQAVPKMTGVPAGRLHSIAGEPHPAHIDPLGCAFEPRCRRAQGSPICRSVQPELESLAPGHEVACHHHDRVTSHEAANLATPPTARSQETDAIMVACSEAVLRVESLGKSFLTRRWQPAIVRAVDDVSFDVARGETLGIVGESGSGKTTLARMVVRLIEPTSGRILIEGRDATRLGHHDLLPIRNRIQVMFQDSRSALNPRMRVEAIVGEPLVIRGQWGQDGVRRVRDMLKRVGLSPSLAFRYPHEFSGGQQQRIALARALMLNPAVLVLDEPVSSLDVSIRAQIINLLKELQDQTRLSYLFIAHDLAVVRNISQRIAVMYLGRIVELGSAKEVCDNPLHPYTRALVDAIPEPDPAVARARQSATLIGDAPSPLASPSGCPFHPRCRHAADVAARAGVARRSANGRELPELCVTERPPLARKRIGRWAACHFA
jgi:peptide/nickel transport system ATP-binding protein